MVEVWIPIVLFVGFFATLSFGLAVVNRRRTAEATARAEVQNRLLEKFGSAKEFVDFLQTDGGKTFLSPMAAPVAASVRTGYEKILRTLSVGVILTVVGLAAMILSYSYADEPSPVVFSGLTLAVGIGFLLSAGLSYRLSKSWGLIQPKGSETLAS